jgi:hypothetical protein
MTALPSDSSRNRALGQGCGDLVRSAKEYFVIAVLPSPSLPIPFTRLVK